MFKKTCATCHYFTRVHHQENGNHYSLEISREFRKRAATGDLSWQRDSESICCHRGVWDEGVGFPESSKLEQVRKLNRRNKCYYIPYQPGMLLSAAEKLQDARLLQTRELQKIRFAVYGLTLTIVGLIVKLLTEKP
ncbi:hypothetical protein [Rhodoferax sp. U11-2br]|uniref:hypothetical protein n=1 Tax=Rhodoferax sp. U11-2br TaxID=2838878 RepID=UPI001BE73F91|nr:hypothetical protein [Rhodoferax sp. U11-2br]MBT3066814.1 hypothetical protein [Rhodoferax sp. U11-2br]